MLRHTLFRGETEPLVMDLPPYRAPTLAGLLQHTWERGWLFLRKAGTVIVVISCALWMLSSYPRPPAEDLAGKAPAEQAQARLAHSWAGRAGRAIEPVMRHVGFDWKASTALLGAFAAKEVFVSQLSIVNALAEGEEGSSRALSETLRRDYTPLQAFCIMLFCLISVPCVMTLAATARETGSWLWSAAQLAGLTVLAYAMTWGVYQGGLWIGRWT
jgi:ferrous iron transport protein B